MPAPDKSIPQSPQPAVPFWQPAAHPPGARAPQRRLRLAMYGAFLALALAVLGQLWSTLQLEKVRAVDASILSGAGYQKTVSQQIGRRAAQLLAAGVTRGDALAEPTARAVHADALSRLLNESGQQALVLGDLLQHQVGTDTGSPAAPALQVWEAARERLSYRGELLLNIADHGSDEDLQHAANAVQTEADATHEAAQRMSTAMYEAAERRSERLQGVVKVWAGALLLLLAGLALLVVEPTARAVRSQLQRLGEQATQLRRLAMVAEQTQAMVLITDRAGRVQWINAAFSHLTGWALQDAIGRSARDLLDHPQADPAALARLDEAAAQGKGLRGEWLNRGRDGSDLWLDVDVRPLHDDAGIRLGFVSVASDITERVQHQQKIDALFAALPVGVVLHGDDGRVVDANLNAERLLGLSLAQLKAQTPPPPSWNALRDDGSAYDVQDMPALRTLRSGRPLLGETVGIAEGIDPLRWLMVNTEPQHDPQGRVTGVVACLSDITERRALQEQLHESARTDALTRLPNRAVVMERLQRAITHAARHPGYGFAVLFMDFDRFKQVNDTLGHGAGDDLLRQIAERLQETLRPGDAVARVTSQLHVAARIGGDEFVVVLEGVQDVAAVKVVAERLLAALSEPYTVAQHPVQSSASIGIVLCGAGTDGMDGQGGSQGTLASADEILRNADTAMYEAKRAGRGRCVVFDHSMHERVVHALGVENDLRVALKDKQLFVAYQPVVDLETRALVGVEALVRWKHPTRGLVMPMEFIGIAEECGLIDAMGAHVLAVSCAQFMQWQADLGSQAPPLLAVNLSRAQLKRGDLVAEVARVLANNGMAPQSLQLEITETLAAQDERIQGTLRELKALGVKLALDDFGTGYSSLACLHQLPVDTVKVDRSFVQHAETVEYHRVLIEATIRVARTLGIRTVAEGIETAGQAALMQRLSCDRGQGYLFGRPMVAAELQRWAQREDFASTA